MTKFKALLVTGMFCLSHASCKLTGHKPVNSDSDVTGFFQTEFVSEPMVLHTKPLSEESIVEYIKRFRMNGKEDDPTMPDKELAKKILLVADKFGIDPYIVVAIIRKESEFQKSAVGTGGAFGLMQIMQSVISESHVQLGQQGPANARKATIDYLQKLMSEIYPVVVGKPFNPKPWSTSMLPVMKTDPWQNIIYGSLILKVYLSLERTKNKNGSMKDWYTKGVQFYNGSGKKVEYAKVVMNWADAMEADYGGVTSISAKVAEEAGTVLDQSATGVTFGGGWTEVKSANAEGGSYRHDQNSSKGTKTAAFKVTGKPGIYRTYARWIDHEAKGASNVPVEVNHLFGKTVAKLNQKVDAGKWNFIGTYTFDPASSSITILNSGTNGYVSADAFKLIETDADPLIIVDSHDRDERRIVLTGSWDFKDDSEEVEQAYNKSIYIANPEGNVATATYMPKTKGKYQVSAHWLNGADHASNVKFIVNAVGAKKEFTMNQKTGGGSWVPLGEFVLDPSSSVVITTEGADGLVIADAVRFDVVP